MLSLQKLFLPEKYITDPSKATEYNPKGYQYIYQKPKKEVISKIESFMQNGKDYINWYEKLSSMVYGGFKSEYPNDAIAAESEAVLFLLFLAVTSVNTMLSQNFDEAANLYAAFHKDLNKELALLFNFATKEIVFNKNFSIEGKNSQYAALEFFQIVKKIGMRDIKAKYKNLQSIAAMYLNRIELSPDGCIRSTLNRHDAVNIIYSQFIERYSTHKIEFHRQNIGKLKIANYAVTLIDPEFSKEMPSNVVLDSWMIKFFYPEDFSEKVDDVAQEKALGYLFSSTDAYMTMANIISNAAKKYDISPSQLQAAIWVAQRRLSGEQIESYDDYLNQISREMSANAVQIKQDVNKFMQEIKYLASDAHLNFKFSGGKVIDNQLELAAGF